MEHAITGRSVVIPNDGNDAFKKSVNMDSVRPNPDGKLPKKIRREHRVA
jgi:hypothetical protein